jgi:hypothetical protein
MLASVASSSRAWVVKEVGAAMEVAAVVSLERMYYSCITWLED